MLARGVEGGKAATEPFLQIGNSQNKKGLPRAPRGHALEAIQGPAGSLTFIFFNRIISAGPVAPLGATRGSAVAHLGPPALKTFLGRKSEKRW